MKTQKPHHIHHRKHARKDFPLKNKTSTQTNNTFKKIVKERRNQNKDKNLVQKCRFVQAKLRKYLDYENDDNSSKKVTINSQHTKFIYDDDDDDDDENSSFSSSSVDRSSSSADNSSCSSSSLSSSMEDSSCSSVDSNSSDSSCSSSDTLEMSDDENTTTTKDFYVCEDKTSDTLSVKPTDEVTVILTSSGTRDEEMDKYDPDSPFYPSTTNIWTEKSIKIHPFPTLTDFDENAEKEESLMYQWFKAATEDNQTTDEVASILNPTFFTTHLSCNDTNVRIPVDTQRQYLTISTPSFPVNPKVSAAPPKYIFKGPLRNIKEINPEYTNFLNNAFDEQINNDLSEKERSHIGAITIMIPPHSADSRFAPDFVTKKETDSDATGWYFSDDEDEDENFIKKVGDKDVIVKQAEKENAFFNENNVEVWPTVSIYGCKVAIYTPRVFVGMVYDHDQSCFYIKRILVRAEYRSHQELATFRGAYEGLDVEICFSNSDEDRRGFQYPVPIIASTHDVLTKQSPDYQASTEHHNITKDTFFLLPNGVTRANIPSLSSLQSSSSSTINVRDYRALTLFKNFTTKNDDQSLPDSVYDSTPTSFVEGWGVTQGITKTITYDVKESEEDQELRPRAVFWSRPCFGTIDILIARELVHDCKKQEEVITLFDKIRRKLYKDIQALPSENRTRIVSQILKKLYNANGRDFDVVKWMDVNQGIFWNELEHCIQQSIINNF